MEGDVVDPGPHLMVVHNQNCDLVVKVVDPCKEVILVEEKLFSSFGVHGVSEIVERVEEERMDGNGEGDELVEPFEGVPWDLGEEKRVVEDILDDVAKMVYPLVDAWGSYSFVLRFFSYHRQNPNEVPFHVKRIC